MKKKNIQQHPQDHTSKIEDNLNRWPKRPYLAPGLIICMKNWHILTGMFTRKGFYTLNGMRAVWISILI
jgi:hypothetical protein